MNEQKPKPILPTHDDPKPPPPPPGVAPDDPDDPERTIPDPRPEERPSKRAPMQSRPDDVHDVTIIDRSNARAPSHGARIISRNVTMLIR